MIPEAELIMRFLVASVVGLSIGLERESVHKPAGVRTHMVVSLGAALFAIMAMQVAPNDLGRIIAGVATGIGFLGAGTIFKAKDDVHGLTTAGSIWVVAALGMCAGFGLYYITIVATFITLIILHLVRISFFKEL